MEQVKGDDSLEEVFLELEGEKEDLNPARRSGRREEPDRPPLRKGRARGRRCRGSPAPRANGGEPDRSPQRKGRAMGRRCRGSTDPSATDQRIRRGYHADRPIEKQWMEMTASLRRSSVTGRVRTGWKAAAFLVLAACVALMVIGQRGGAGRPDLPAFERRRAGLAVFCPDGGRGAAGGGEWAAALPPTASCTAPGTTSSCWPCPSRRG